MLSPSSLRGKGLNINTILALVPFIVIGVVIYICVTRLDSLLKIFLDDNAALLRFPAYDPAQCFGIQT